jgi:hypothetical protein
LSGTTKVGSASIRQAAYPLRSLRGAVRVADRGIERERQLKRWTREKKEALIAGDSRKLKRLSVDTVILDWKLTKAWLRRTVHN